MDTADAGVADGEIEQAAEAAAGVSELRAGQREAIEAALVRDTVAVLASGTGKTAVYETVAELLGGPAVVVSPTLALQRDQVAALREHGHTAASVSSARGPAASRKTLEQFASGELEIVLLAPEQLAKDDVVDALKAARPALVVVDEAHCVSEWGHDFRPDYLAIGGAVERLGHPRVLALTATAAPRVRRDVADRLALRDPAFVVGAADRPEIHLAARLFASERERDDALVEAALAVDGAVLVYAPTRRRAEALAERLTQEGRAAKAYHAGLPAVRRREVADAFLDGTDHTVVATSAFGMGVDRPDVRAVLHAGPATSVDEYFQEAGRAGRDGEPAAAQLFYRLEDFALGRFFESGGGAREEDLRAVVRSLLPEPAPATSTDGDGAAAPTLTQAAVVERTGLPRRRAALALGTLVGVKALERKRSGVRLARRLLQGAGEGRVDVAAVVAAALAERDRLREVQRTRVDLMRAYTETTDCRRRVVLELLGEEHPQRCGNCDNCDAGTSEEAADRPYPIGGQVEHPEWGRGTVSHYEADRVVVLFADAGYRTLALALVKEKSLLTPAA